MILALVIAVSLVGLLTVVAILRADDPGRPERRKLEAPAVLHVPDLTFDHIGLV